ncbi:MAG: discoidin domain-containing protein, partial [Cytophagales bacterium]|nr:discoidin domain-containing protein [Cytophagales bacterium]
GTSTSAEGSVTTPGPAVGDIVFAVNAGGGQVVATNGTSFEEDYNFTGGGTYTWNNTFTNTSDPGLYGPHRYGSFSYAVAVPSGTYEVNFHLTEPTGNVMAGGRVFNIRSEGDTLVRGLDVYKRTGGRNVAYVLTRTVDVTDGTLNLNFDASTGSQDASSLVQALEVRRSNRKKTTDELADFSKTFARTSGLYTTGGSSISNGDNSLVGRNSNSTQSITYKAGDIRDFTVSFIYHTTFPATVKVLRSSDNGTYTAVTIDSAFKATSGGWYLATYTPRTNLSGTDYLKIEVSGGAQTWTPYFSKVELWHNGLFNSAGTATCTEVTGTPTVNGTTGSWNNSGNTREKAFDGDVNTYFDAATADGNWTGRDLGSAKVICKISYHPRIGGFENRMVGGKFQGSNVADFSSGVVDLVAIATAPATAWTDATVSNTSSFRYVRYLAPAGSYGNIAEIKIHASSAARVAAAVAQMADGPDHFGKHIRLYPNPSDGETVLHLAGFAGEKEVVVTLTDLTGKCIRRLVVKPGSDLDATRISTAGMARGMYAVRVQGYETLKAQKLVVR